MARNPFEDPFTNPGSAAVGLESASPAVPRRVVPTVFEELTVPEQPEPVSLLDDEDPLVPVPTASNPDLLSEPMDREKGPTAFQRKHVNWDDGNPETPKAVDDTGSDFLEVDYQFGPKWGATDRPVLAANVFGRQFTAEQLQQDEEGRKLLDLMTKRRMGTYNSGGMLSDLVEGFTDWSKSDIPYYGWMSDIGTSISEAADMSKTIRKLQNGEKVSPHEAIAVRRYMLLQELESTRSTSYQIGSVARQAIPFMGEMAMNSLVYAGIVGGATGVASGGFLAIPGAVVGGIAGAAVTTAKALAGIFTRRGLAAATRKVVNQQMASYAKKGLADIAAGEMSGVASSAVKAFGKKGAAEIYREALGKAARGMTAGASKADIAKKASQLVAEELSTHVAMPGEAAARALGRREAIKVGRVMLNSDTRLAVEQGTEKSVEQYLAKSVGLDLSKNPALKSAWAYNKKMREAWRKLASDKAAFAKFRNEVSGGLADKVLVAAEGGHEAKTFAQVMAGGLKSGTGNGFVSDAYARTVLKDVTENVFRNMEIKYGTSWAPAGYGHRFVRWFGEHATRGLLQSEHAYFADALPTLAHSGLKNFWRSSGALKEALGRVFVEAQVQGGMQMAVANGTIMPVVAAANGVSPGDVAFKGQLGFQLNALMNGDRAAMDTARACAIGSMFAEYMSESAGRGLGLLVGGAAGSAASRIGVGGVTSESVTRGVASARETFVDPLTRRAGAMLDKAVNATFGKGGFENVGLDKLTSFATRALNDFVPGNRVAASEIGAAIRNRSLDGIGSEFRSALDKMGVKSIGGFIRKVYDHEVGGARAQAFRCYLGYVLVQKGFTPERIVRFFRQAGKGNMLEEMGEERLGDFVRGLMGWDDTTSDAEVSDRIRSMFSGFTDPQQLEVEFFGFMFPGAVRHLALSSQAWLANGALAKYRESANRAMATLSASRAGGPTVTVTSSAAHRDAVNEWERSKAEALDRALGTEAEAKAATVANAKSNFETRDTLEQRIRDAGGLADPAKGDKSGVSQELADAMRGRVSGILGATSEEVMAIEMDRLAQSLASIDDAGEFETAMAQTGASAVFGEDGAKAIRRLRARSGRTSAEDSETEVALKDYRELEMNPPKAADYRPASVDEAVERIVVNVGGRNVSATAEQEEAARKGYVAGSPVTEDARDQLTADLADIYRQYGRASFNFDRQMGGVRKALSRFIGLAASAATGDIAYASMNPAEFVTHDVGLPHGLTVGGLQAYNSSLQYGYAKLTGEQRAALGKEITDALDEAVASGEFVQRLRDLHTEGRVDFDAIEKAGEEFYLRSIAELAATSLAANGVSVVAQDDSRAEARAVVARRHGWNQVSDDMVAHSPELKAEVESVHEQIVDGVIRLVSQGRAFRYTSHAQQGSDAPLVAFDFARAVKSGTEEEIVAAVMNLPAFRHLTKTCEVSSFSEFDKEVAFSDALAMHCDVDEICDTDLATISPNLADGTAGEEDRLDMGRLQDICRILRRDISKHTLRDTCEVATQFVEEARLLRSRLRSSFETRDGSDGRAFVVPSGTGFYAFAKVSDADPAVDAQFDSYAAARDAVTAAGFEEIPRRLVVSNSREFVSSDAMSLLFLKAGNNRDLVRSWYLRELGETGDQMTVATERELPHWLRKRSVETDGVVKWDWEYSEADAKKAMEKTRTLLRFAREYQAKGQNASAYLAERDVTDKAREARMKQCKAAYDAVFGQGGMETTAAKVAAKFGVVRSANRASAVLGSGSDMYVLRADAVDDGRNVWLSPDYFTDGHHEALLRKSFESGLEDLVFASRDGRDNGRVCSYAVREFERCARELAARLERQNPTLSKRIASMLESEFSGQLTVRQVAKVVTSTWMFSCDRGLRQTGNGFMFAPELAAVADEFRGTLAARLIASLADEAVGGVGLFHTAKFEAPAGLSDFVRVFARNVTVQAEARKSAVFGREGAAAPSYVRLKVTEGGNAETAVMKTDGTVSFAEYAREGVRGMLDRITAEGASFAEAAAKGEGYLTTAQVFRMAERSGLLAGETRGEGPKAMLSTDAIRLSANNAAKAKARGAADVLSRPSKLRVAVALRRMAQVSGGDFVKSASLFRKWMRDHLVDEKYVGEIFSMYREEAFLQADETDAERAERREAERAADQEAVENGDATTDDVAWARRDSMLVDDANMKEISEGLHLFLPAEGGAVGATLDRVRSDLRRENFVSDEDLESVRGSLGDFDQARRDVIALREALRVNLDPVNFADNQAKSVLWRGSDTEVKAVLDSNVRVLVALGRYAHAAALSMMRSIPDSERTLFLQGWAQSHAIEGYSFEWDDENGGFGFSRIGSYIESDRTPKAVSVAYSSLLSSPLFAKVGPKAEDLAKRMGEIIADLRFGDKYTSLMPRRIAKFDDAAPYPGDAFKDKRFDIDPSVLGTVARFIEGDSELTFEEFEKAVDALRDEVMKRAAGAADAVDAILGKDTTVAYALRSRTPFVRLAEDAKAAFGSEFDQKAVEARGRKFFGKDTDEKLRVYVDAEKARWERERRFAVTLLLRYSNYFTVCDNARGLKQQGNMQLWYCSSFLSDLIEEPIEAAGRVLSGDVRSAVSEGWRSKAGIAARAAKWGEAIAARKAATKVAPLDVLRETLAAIGRVKARYDVPLDMGLTMDGAMRNLGTQFDPSRPRAVGNLGCLFDGYVSTMPRNSQSVGGRAANMKDAAKNRAVTYLSNVLAVELRGCNSELFRVGGQDSALDQFMRNDGRWDDGNPFLVALVGAKREGGELVPKEYLTELAVDALRDEYVRHDYQSLIFPTFPGDKPAKYAMQVPLKVAKAWLEEVGKNKELFDSLPAVTRDLVKKAISQPSGTVDTEAPEVVVAPGGSRNAAAYAGQIGGVNTLRIPGAKLHFGNPFSNQDYRGVERKVGTIKEAVERYESWLRGQTDTDLAQDRRKFIVNAIESGRLDDKKLVYYTNDVDHGDYDGTGKIRKYDPRTSPNHAHVLAKLIGESKARRNGKGSSSRADEWNAMYSLVAASIGQIVNPKRTAVLQSTGPYLPSYLADADGNVAPEAGLYFRSVIGGTTGASMTGAFALGGVMADAVQRISDKVDGKPAVSAKIHCYGPLVNTNMKKGQGRVMGDDSFGFDEDDGVASGLSIINLPKKEARAELFHILRSRLKIQVQLLPGMDNILDPVPKPGDQATAEEAKAYEDCKKAHDAAVRVAKAALHRDVTIYVDDLETNKEGLFGSSCGFSDTDEEGKPVLDVTVNGKQLLVRELDAEGNVGDWKRGKDMPAEFRVAEKKGCPIADEIKNGQIPIAMLLSAYCLAEGKSVSDADVGNIVAYWRLPDGNVRKGTMKDVLLNGDHLSFEPAPDRGPGVARMRYRTRTMLAQLVANNANTSTPSDHGMFPTNAMRDFEVYEEIINAVESQMLKFGGEPTHRFVDGALGYSLLRLWELRENPSLVRTALSRDGQLLELFAKYPNNNEIRDELSSKVRNFVARYVVVPFHGSHGYMIESSSNGHTAVDESEFDHTLELEDLPGVDAYTKDCMRDAGIFDFDTRRFYGYDLGGRVFGRDRSWGTGAVNVRQKGFRYGLHLDQEKFAKFCSSPKVRQWLEDDRAFVDDLAAGYAGVEGYQDAHDMAVLASLLSWEHSGARGFPKRQFLGCFIDYRGKDASTCWGANDVSFADLWPVGRDGKEHFDLCAIEGGMHRRTARDGQRRITLLGSCYAAHRSPSGNIRAFSGTVRAMCPLEYETKGKYDGRPLQESQYVIPPTTMFAQGSDTDGDSAGVQNQDETSETWITDSDVSAFMASCHTVDDVAKFLKTATCLQNRTWTHRVGERMDGTGGFTLVRPEVINKFSKVVFEAQKECQMRDRAIHQGFGSPEVREKIAENRRRLREAAANGDAEAAERVVEFDGLADDVYYGWELLEAGVDAKDYGFRGNHPVGPDLVYGERIDQESAEYISSRLSPAARKLVEGSLKVGAKMSKVFEAGVDALGKAKSNVILDPDTVKRLASAGADAARARGISVFNQSRFLRALLKRLGHDMNSVPLLDADGYSPLVDFDSHDDGVSNNLFDVMKKMFATRAGWTKDMLPYFVGYLVSNFRTGRGAQDARFDSKYCLVQALNFLAEMRGGAETAQNPYGYRGDTVIGRMAIMSDPLRGKALTRAALAAHGYKFGPTATVASMCAKVCENAGLTHWAYPVREIGSRLETDWSAQPALVKPPKKRPDNLEYVRLNQQEQLIVAAWAVGKQSARDTAFRDKLLAVSGALAEAKAYGEAVDHLTLVRQDLGKLVRPASDDAVRIGEDASGDYTARHQLGVCDGIRRLVGDSVDTTAEADRRFFDMRDRVYDGVADLGSPALALVTEDRGEKTYFSAEDGTPLYVTGVPMRENLDRLNHLFGAVRLLSDADVAAMRRIGDTTADFMHNLAEAVRIEAGSRTASGLPVASDAKDAFVRSLTVRDGEIGVDVDPSSDATRRLSEGFAAMLSDTKGEIVLRNVADRNDRTGMPVYRELAKVTPRQFALMLLVHSSAHKPFGPVTEYLGKSNLPSVFDVRLSDPDLVKGNLVRSLESHRPWLVGSDDGICLAAVPPVRYGRGTAYDLFRTLDVMRSADTGDRTASRGSSFMDALAADARKRPSAVDVTGLDNSWHDTVSISEDRSTRVIEPEFGTPMTTRTSVDAFDGGPSPVRFMAPGERRDRALGYRSVEEAYNAHLWNMREKVMADPATHRRDRTDFLLNGRAYSDMPGRRAAVLKRIVSEAAKAEPRLWEIIRFSDGLTIGHPDAAMAEALDAVADEIMTGRVPRPDEAKPRLRPAPAEGVRMDSGGSFAPTPSSGSFGPKAAVDWENDPENPDSDWYVGDEDGPVPSETIDLSGGTADVKGGITRRDFLQRLDEAVPGLSEAARKDFARNAPEAIRRAFETAFPGAKAETVMSEGNPTNLIRVTRKASSGNDVVTYVSWGDVLGSDMTDDGLLASVVDMVNRRRGSKVLTVEKLKAMGPDNVRLLCDLVRRAGIQTGESADEWSLSFAPVMSGLIRVGTNATFRTLFHEYYHQMLGCYRRMGIVDAEEEKLVNDAFGGEEGAATAYSDYLIGADDMRLADAGEQVEKVFERLREYATRFAAVAKVGTAPDGEPAFIAMVARADAKVPSMKADVARAEQILLGEEGRFDVPKVLSAMSHREIETAVAQVMRMLLVDEWRETSVLNLKRTLMSFDVAENTGPQPESVLDLGFDLTGSGISADEISRITDGVLSEAARVNATEGAERVSAFLRLSLAKFRRDGVGPDFEAAAEAYSASKAVDGKVPDAALASVVSSARRLVRYVAAATGVSDDAVDEILSSDEVGRLALRLVANYEAERSKDRRGEAEHAGADYIMGRALERVEPASYGRFCMSRAKAAQDMFIAKAHEYAVRAQNNPEGAERYRAQEAECRRLANLVTKYAKMIARGDDMHLVAEYAQVDNLGNLHGLVLKNFMGGATKAASEAVDGIHRFEGGTLGLDLSDPQLVAAFDVASQAFFTAEAARSYRVRMDEGGKETAKYDADILEGVGGSGVDALPTDEATVVKSIEETLDVDAKNRGERRQELQPEQVQVPAAGRGDAAFDRLEPDVTHTPEWILSNPGSWLAADMQRDLMGVGLRDMMTDHVIRAATERGYRLVTDAVAFFGADAVPGKGVRVLEQVMSKLGRNEAGDFTVSDENAHATYGYSKTRGYLLGIFNWQEERTGEAFDSRDLEDVNWALQTVRHIASRARRAVTGVDVRALVSETDARRIRERGAAALSPAEVLRRKCEPSRENPMTALDEMLERLIDDLPRSILGIDGEYTEATGIGNGYYSKVVDAVVSAVGKAGSKDDARSISASARKALVSAGLVCGRGNRAYFAVPVRDSVAAWDASEAKRKLAESAGRPAGMLSLHYWANLFADECRRINDAASKSMYIRNGLGSSFSLAGTPAFWWHGGTGAHKVDSLKYANLLAAIRDVNPSPTERLRENHEALFEFLERADPKYLRQRAFPEGGKRPVVSSTQLLYLANLMGLAAKDDHDFDVAAFARDIAAGEYESGERGRAVIMRDATVADVFMTVNRMVNEDLFNEATSGTTLPTAVRQRLADMRAVNDMIEQRLYGLVPGSVVPVSEEQQLAADGRLGSSMTAPEALAQMCKDLVTAERFRGCLAQMLTSVAADGTPRFVVDPTSAAVSSQALGLPDEYWGALARHVIAGLSGKAEGVPQYDMGLTGAENMHNVAEYVRAVSTKPSGKASGKVFSKPLYGNLDTVETRAYPIFSQVWCRLDDTDTAGNVSVLSKMQGGEAASYMKQLLGTLSAPSSNAAWRVIDGILSWSKLSSVGFSAFFQIATVFESPTAAAGFWHTLAGMSKTGSGLARAVGRARRRFGGTGAFQGDAVFMRDIERLLNTDDPFVREARELCDLIGMPLDFTVDYTNDRNESNPVLGNRGTVANHIELLAGLSERAKRGSGRYVRNFLDFMYKHPTDYTFNVLLNAVKMSVVMQTMRRLREECARGGRPFDPVAELRRHSAYVNAEIGGIDPARYAWATPQARRWMSMAMFSWQWTVGAWAAGSGEAVSDAIFGGHSTTAESRRYAMVRWMKMIGIVKFGVPVFMQAAIKALSKAIHMALPPPDDPLELEEHERLGREIDEMPWWAFNNERKAGSLSFDVTPMLKLAARIPGFAALKSADIPVISALVPAYGASTDQGRNTTGKRRYYMHFGKQSDEFWRWFSDAPSQLLSKTSVPVQKVFESVFGTLAPNGYTKSYADKGLFERFFNGNFSADENALVNLLTMFTSFSAQSVGANVDAGFLSAVGPMRMGASERSTRIRIAERLADIAEDDRSNNPWSYSRNRRKLNLVCTDIMREAALNGVDPYSAMTSALGDVAKIEYVKLMSALPKNPETGKVDVDAVQDAVRALTRINRKASDIRQSIVDKYEKKGVDIKKHPALYAAIRGLLRGTQSNPLEFRGDVANEFLEAWLRTADPRYLRSTSVAERGGEAFSNFLATDEVPETLFGVPVVTDVTPADAEFFRLHPEAGGFYELEGENDGPGNGPTNGDVKGGETAKFEAAIAEAIPFIKEHEGFREKAYRDTVGKWTIGYGQTEVDGRPVREGDVIDEAAASRFVERRVRNNAADLYKNSSWTNAASAKALAALYDIAYNAGVGALSERKSPSLNRNGRAASGTDAVDAVIWSEVPTYVRAGGKESKGLRNRRQDAIRRWKE